MWIMAVCAVIGGLDYLFGNKLKLGQEFEKGFQYLGPMGLTMAGIICVAPILSDVLGKAVVPAFTAIGVDPGMFGGILAIDLGGYQMAGALAVDPLIGKYSGIVVGAIFGCTIVFTIPVGLGMLEAGDRPLFSKGLLFGLIAMPAGLLLGALACGMSFFDSIWQNIPLLVMAAFLLLGFWKAVDKMIRGFSYFAAGIRAITLIGLIGGAFTYLTGVEVLPGAAPLMEAMEVVSSVGIVLLGSLPMGELLQPILRRPLNWLAEKTGMNTYSVAGLMLGLVGILPVIAIIKDMDDRGKVVNGAYLVCGASVFAAHLGFAAGVAPEMVTPMILAKLVGGCAGAILALWATGKKKTQTDTYTT